MIDTKFQLYQCFYFITIEAFFIQKRLYLKRQDIAKIQTSHIKYSVLWRALYFVAQLSFFVSYFPNKNQDLRLCVTASQQFCPYCIIVFVLMSPILSEFFSFVNPLKTVKKIMGFSRNFLNFICMIIHYNNNILNFYSKRNSIFFLYVFYKSVDFLFFLITYIFQLFLYKNNIWFLIFFSIFFNFESKNSFLFFYILYFSVFYSLL